MNSKLFKSQPCRECGTPVPKDAPFGHCPNCLIKLGFGPAPADSPADSPVSARLFSEKNGLKLAIADLGIGIPAAEKELIFEKFYRVGSEETRETKGTGLGLYIVRQVVKAHKGTITVSDNQPRGTVFTVLFPLKNR